MARNVHERRPKTATLRRSRSTLGYVDLGQISIEVLGALHASAEVKAALYDRTR
jgi:hypothetical protein